MPNYDGLTRNQWPGTFSPSSNHPIVLDTELRGSLRYASGDSGDRLSDITGQRLQDGMLVYIKNEYTEGGITYQGSEYYKYSILSGQSRNPNTGELPNAAANWTSFSDAQVGEATANLDSAGINQVIDAFPASTFRTVKYIIQLEHDSDNKYHSQEIMLTHNGTNVFLTEYAEVKTDSSLGTFDASIVDSNVSITLSPSYTNTSFKAKRISVDA